MKNFSIALATLLKFLCNLTPNLKWVTTLTLGKQSKIYTILGHVFFLRWAWFGRDLQKMELLSNTVLLYGLKII